MACHSFTRSRDILRGGKHAQTLQGVDDAGCIRSDRRSNRRHRWRQHTTRHRRRGGEAAPGAGVGRGSDSGIEGADFSGTTVTVFGPENAATDVGAITTALGEFAAASGIHIDYTGARDFEEQINAQVESENPPDIAIFPQPGKLAGFARNGDLFALPDDVLASVSANWAPTWMSFGNVDGTQFGIPVKTDIKSLVWYIPSTFAEYGYTVPTTLDEFYALTDQMIADGHTPLCVGIESGPGHRLAVHRLGRGAGAAQPGHRLLQPVGDPRGAVQRPADRRGDADRRRPVGQARRGVRRLAARSRRRRSDPTPSRCSTATA